MAWYLDPRKLLRTARGLQSVHRGGGPARVRLEGIEGPEGWLLPSLLFDLDVIARDGRTVPLDPTLPLPPLVGAGWRLARFAGVPVISSIDPARIRLDLRIPKLPSLEIGGSGTS